MSALLGTASRRRLRRLAVSAGASEYTPVRLPPGCARLLTKPNPTGSPWIENTTGIEVLLLFLAAIAAGVLIATITATLRLMRSAITWARPVPSPTNRDSISMLCPSTYPSSPRLSRNRTNEDLGESVGEGDVPNQITPIRGILP